LAVEGIGMMCGQIERAKACSAAQGKIRNRRSATPAIESALLKVSFRLVCLTAISVKETTLISRTAVPFRRADIAARERRSGR
jgi:hypothetical protein